MFYSSPFWAILFAKFLFSFLNDSCRSYVILIPLGSTLVVCRIEMFYIVAVFYVYHFFPYIVTPIWNGTYHCIGSFRKTRTCLTWLVKTMLLITWWCKNQGLISVSDKPSYLRYNDILTHWGRVTHMCVDKLTIICSNNGLSPGRRQAIIQTNAGILLIGPWGTNFSEIFNRNLYIFIQENAFQTVVCEMLAILSQPQCVKAIRLVI